MCNADISPPVNNRSPVVFWTIGITFVMNFSCIGIACYIHITLIPGLSALLRQRTALFGFALELRTAQSLCDGRCQVPFCSVLLRVLKTAHNAWSHVSIDNCKISLKIHLMQVITLCRFTSISLTTWQPYDRLNVLFSFVNNVHRAWHVKHRRTCRVICAKKKSL